MPLAAPSAATLRAVALCFGSTDSARKLKPTTDSRYTPAPGSRDRTIAHTRRPRRLQPPSLLPFFTPLLPPCFPPRSLPLITPFPRPPRRFPAVERVVIDEDDVLTYALLSFALASACGTLCFANGGLQT
ncbi:hypothetical protein B0H14DRAFT_3437373 [Mycena olivaceomarginata]|nr:hypothetical protein B0H14DRAFT_3437373 [Mycena olivaceomarginata]